MTTSNAHSDDRHAAAWLVYDGDCPFCSRYVTLVRLRKSLGRVELVNAREGGPIVDEVRQAGLDLDDGMVLKLGERYLHGAECIHALALMTGPSDLFNRVNAALFRSPRLARFLYPILRTGRNATLRLLGRERLAETHRGLP
jgi:predicted DCC family thiol-disulfide oxidoreductase YuxK